MTLTRWRIVGLLGVVALAVVGLQVVYTQQQAPSTSATSDMRLWGKNALGVWTPVVLDASGNLPTTAGTGGDAGGSQQESPSTSSTVDARLWAQNTMGVYVPVVLDADGRLPTAVSGGTLPAPGSDTQVVFNDGGFLGGDAGLTYSKTTDTLTAISVAQNSFLVLERANGTAGSPTSTLTGETLSTFSMGGYVTGVGYRLGASIIATQNGAVGTFVPTDVVLTTFEAAGSWRWTFGTDGVLTTEGAIKAPVFIAGGGTTTSPAVANIGANSCGTSAASIAGTDNAWEITVGATAGTACRVTFDTTAPTTWECAAWNKTTLTLNATPHQTAASATTVDITGTAFVAADKIGGVCFAR